jgi:hypothetical protein
MRGLGIDVVAYSRELDCRLGIYVKSRTRRRGTEAENVFLYWPRPTRNRQFGSRLGAVNLAKGAVNLDDPSTGESGENRRKRL